MRMQIPNLYTPENVERARYAQLGAGILSTILCGYLIVSTLLSVQGIRRADRVLSSVKMQSGTLSREAARLRKLAASQENVGSGGVETFALQLSRWARAKNVSIETLSPEGTPSATDIKIDDAKLGTWEAHNVRVDGRGDFLQVMSLMNEFRNPHAPVQLESFTLQSASSGAQGIIGYSLRVTIYARSEAG